MLLEGSNTSRFRFRPHPRRYTGAIVVHAAVVRHGAGVGVADFNALAVGEAAQTAAGHSFVPCCFHFFNFFHFYNIFNKKRDAARPARRTTPLVSLGLWMRGSASRTYYLYKSLSGLESDLIVVLFILLALFRKTEHAASRCCYSKIRAGNRDGRIFPKNTLV